MLSSENRLVWDDLEEQARLKVLTGLLETLETHAFIMSDVFDQDQETMVEKTKEIGEFYSWNSGWANAQNFYNATPSFFAGPQWQQIILN